MHVELGEPRVEVGETPSRRSPRTLPVSVVVAGDRTANVALCALFELWGWSVVASAPDDLGAVTLVRRWQPDLLIVHSSGLGRFGDLDLLRRQFPGTRIVTLVDIPQQLTADVTGVLSGLPGAALRNRLDSELASPLVRIAG
jgi:hypothetical protein